MSIVPLSPPCDQPKHIYNVSERAILDPFKREYISLATPAIRRQFFLSRIWPSMYRYWHDKEDPLNPSNWDERSKILSKWMYNNWRLPHRGGKVKGVLTVRKCDVLWNTRKEEVWKEIAVILKVPEANTRTEKWFQTRPIAIQNILMRMDNKETEKLDEQVREIEENGYSEDQKRSHAEKYCTRRLDNSSKSHWLEMGLMTMSVVAYRSTDGKLSVEIHENVSQHVGVTERSFEEEYDGKAREIRRTWLDYVRNILEEKAGGPTPLGAPDPEILCASPEGFPLFPPGFSCDTLKKKDCEKVLRNYFKQNYLLATARQSEDVPYKDMSRSTTDRRKFVNDQYLPPGFTMRDPHNLKIEESQKLIKFLIDRQASHPPSQVFRFHAYKFSRKGSEILSSIYPDEVDAENPPVLKKKPKRNKRKNPTQPSPGANVGAAADQSNTSGSQWNDPNLLFMTPTPEPPDRRTPVPARLDVSPPFEHIPQLDNATFPTPEGVRGPGADPNLSVMRPNPEAPDRRTPVPARLDVSPHFEHSAQLENATFPTPEDVRGPGADATTNNSITPDLFFPTLAPIFSETFLQTPTPIGASHNSGQIIPGPHQMLVGDWSNPFFGNVANTGVHNSANGNNNLQAYLGLQDDFGSYTYDAGAEGIDYGVPLNMPTPDIYDRQEELEYYSNPNATLGEQANMTHGRNQCVYGTPGNAENQEGQQNVVQLHFMAQPNVGMASAMNEGMSQNNVNPVGGGECMQPSPDCLLTGRQDLPVQSVSGRETTKPKRTADDLAAQEAMVMAIPAKRRRIPRERKS